jgi:predicted RNA-binding Zn ribbon-like protein
MPALRTEPSRVPRFKFVGGAPCLDFTNTVDWTAEGFVDERLTSFADVVDWAVDAGIVGADEARLLRRTAAAHPRRAAKAYGAACMLRATLHAIFDALAHGRAPDATDLGALNALLPKSLSRLRLAADEGAGWWAWSAEDRKLTRVLWPIVWSAATLLTSEESRLLRTCALETCGWMYLDRSRNRRRAWCDMRVCGNRAKARRHYARRKERMRTQA